jgi:hypothetical protein
MITFTFLLKAICLGKLAHILIYLVIYYRVLAWIAVVGGETHEQASKDNVLSVGKAGKSTLREYLQDDTLALETGQSQKVP